jgi:hypothetical protein
MTLKLIMKTTCSLRKNGQPKLVVAVSEKGKKLHFVWVILKTRSS